MTPNRNKYINFTYYILYLLSKTFENNLNCIFKVVFNVLVLFLVCKTKHFYKCIYTQV